MLRSKNQTIISRRDIIHWVNTTLNLEYTKLEDLTNGAAYCLLMNIVQPGSITSKKIKIETRLDHEILLHYKALQNSFRKYGVDKEISITNLMKGRFQEHLVFSQWFKRFFDSHVEKRKNDSITDTKSCGKVSTSDSAEVTQTISKSISKSTFHNNFTYTNAISAELIGLKSEYNKMRDEFKEDQQTIKDLSRERQFYYEKLFKIEALCNDYEGSGYGHLIAKLQEILFKEEDGFTAPLGVEDKAE